MKYILILPKTNSPIVYVEFFFSLVLVVAVNICTHVFYFILLCLFILWCFTLVCFSVTLELNQLSSLHYPLKTLVHS